MPSQQSSSSGSSGNKIVIIIIVVLLALGLFSFLGMFAFGKLLGYGVQKAIETGSGVQVNYNNGTVGIPGVGTIGGNGQPNSVSMTGKDGETLEIGATVKLPKNFPATFPLMQGLNYTTAYANSDEYGDNYYVGFSRPGSFDEIRAYYETELAKQGYKSDGVVNTADGFTESFSKPKADDKQDSVGINAQTASGVTFGSISIDIAK